MAFMGIILGLGPLFHILLGFRASSFSKYEGISDVDLGLRLGSLLQGPK